MEYNNVKLWHYHEAIVTSIFFNLDLISTLSCFLLVTICLLARIPIARRPKQEENVLSLDQQQYAHEWGNHKVVTNKLHLRLPSYGNL